MMPKNAVPLAGETSWSLERAHGRPDMPHTCHDCGAAMDPLHVGLRPEGDRVWFVHREGTGCHWQAALTLELP